MLKTFDAVPVGFIAGGYLQGCFPTSPRFAEQILLGQDSREQIQFTCAVRQSSVGGQECFGLKKSSRTSEFSGLGKAHLIEALLKCASSMLRPIVLWSFQ